MSIPRESAWSNEDDVPHRCGQRAVGTQNHAGITSAELCARLASQHHVTIDGTIDSDETAG